MLLTMLMEKTISSTIEYLQSGVAKSSSDEDATERLRAATQKRLLQQQLDETTKALAERSAAAQEATDRVDDLLSEVQRLGNAAADAKEDQAAKTAALRQGKWV
eukprot:gene21238-52105_t